MSLSERIKTLVNASFDQIVDLRRHLHAHPELSYQEFETSKFIKSQLDTWGISYKDGYVKTGLVASIEGKNPAKKVIALRGDMDALPIVETNNVSYKSQNEGVMHACGHDVHTSSLLGVAHIVNQLKDEFEGTILFIFQPGEERLPGGAKLMLEEGALENPKPEVIIGQHVYPELEAGKVGLKPGKYMASADEIYVTVKGQGGHAALPHLTVDPILIASHIIVALQQLVSRKSMATMPTVLSFGKIEGHGATNIIPDEVKLEGTFRTFDEKWRSEAHTLMTQMAESIAKGMGGECEFRIDKGYPYLVNDDAVVARAKSNAQAFLGEENVVDLDLRMTAEDFAYFSHQFPCVFYRLGIRNDEMNIKSGLHTSTFNIDEEALRTSVGTMTWLALKELQDGE